MTRVSQGRREGADPELQRICDGAADRLFGPPPPPSRIGRYRVVARLGGGAMGVVFAAMDDALDRRVAIKLLHAHVAADPLQGRGQGQGQARLLREARALAQISHPNVVTIYEVGVHRGRVFLAMEALGGEPLSAWLRAQPRPPEAILGVLSDAARGLAAAHAAGLVHRDVKPANIVVDRLGRARVVDFGLVAAFPRAGGGGLTPLTGADVIIGSPAYMAPEQVRGEPATAASDLYALCLVLYEALVGERPLAERGRGVDAVVAEDRRLPPRLRRFIAQGLAADPARRPAMVTLLEDLRPRRPSRPGLGGAALIAGGFFLGLLGLLGLFGLPGGDARIALALPWSVGGGRLLRGGPAGEVVVTEPPRGASSVGLELRLACGGGAGVTALAGGGPVIAAATEAGELCLWRLDGREARSLPAPRGGDPGAPIVALALDGAGEALAIGRGGAVEVHGIGEDAPLRPQRAEPSGAGRLLGLRFVGEGLMVIRDGGLEVHPLDGASPNEG